MKDRVSKTELSEMIELCLKSEKSGTREGIRATERLKGLGEHSGYKKVEEKM